MNNRTMNTLTALSAALTLVAGGWLFGQPVPSRDRAANTFQHPETAGGPRATPLPYLSLAQPLPQRRND